MKRMCLYIVDVFNSKYNKHHKVSNTLNLTEVGIYERKQESKKKSTHETTLSIKKKIKIQEKILKSFFINTQRYEFVK